MRLTLTSLPSRLALGSKANQEGVLAYDGDNGYPQRMQKLVANSGTATQCLRLFSKYVCGKGFADTSFYKATVNRKNQTVDYILRKITEDFPYGGFALHFNYNLLGEITEVYHIPWEYCRLGWKDEAYDGRIAVYKDWTRERYTRLQKESIIFYKAFNPSQAVSQINEAGIENYKGQVLYYSTAGTGEYPLACFDSVLEDIDTDSQMKVGRNANVRNNYSVNQILEYVGKFESDEERDQVQRQINEGMGQEDAGAVAIVEVPAKDTVEFKEVKNLLSDKLRALDSRLTAIEIARIFNVPPMLIGIQPEGGLTFSNEIINQAKTYFSENTEPERILLEEIFKNIFSFFTNRINPTNDFSIMPLIKPMAKEADNEVLTINERREQGGLAPVVGGDTIYLPSTLIPAIETTVAAPENNI